MPAQMLRSNDAGEVADRTPSLMGEHLGLVHHVARQLARRVNDEVELDELVSAGTVGLAQAIESFESTRGLSFSTFAVPRIRGAMLDELRRQDHVPRSVRRKCRAIADARASLARELGRPPRDSEVAHVLGIPGSTLRQWEMDIEGSIHVSLDAREHDARAERVRRRPAEALADERGIDVEEEIDREQQLVLLQIALRRLTAQERAVLALHYQEELKLQEVAQVLGLSPSRISQVRTEALAKLRRAMSI